MKTKSKILVGFAIAAALIIGFLIGLLVDYPATDNEQLTGTIGRVSNYRNTKATEAEIKLKNDLQTDAEMRKIMVNYLNFYYAKSLKLNNSIEFALNQAKADEAFATQYATQLHNLETYSAFLENSRKDLLMTILICRLIEASTPEMVRAAIIQSNNVIAQMNYRNSAVLEFIEVLDTYIQKVGPSANANLAQAHDQMVFNQLASSIATRDKVMIKYLDKKRLYATDIQSTPLDYKTSMTRDLEKLNTVYHADMEKLASFDQEKLGFTDSEGLKIIFDKEKLGLDAAEKLGMFNDIERLGIVFDAEKLRLLNVERLGLLDTEKLGLLDTEKLGLLDTEKLSALDSEKLGLLDSEKLGLLDSEKLGLLDFERLGFVIPDFEKLGIQ